MSSQKSPALTFGVNYTQAFIRLGEGGLILTLGQPLIQMWPTVFNPDAETIIRVLISAGALGTGLFLVLSALITLINRPRISLYKAGIRYESLIRKNNWRWEAITGIDGGLTTFRARGGIPIFTQGSYNLYSGDKVVLKATGLTADVDEWYAIVVQAISTTQKPKTVERLRLGETIRFGHLSLNRNEIHIGKKALSFQEITEIRSDENYMMFYKNNGKYPWKILGVGGIRNAGLFTELANELITQNQGQARRAS